MAEKVMLSLDLGTTLLAGRLTGANGVLLAETEEPNPQTAFGDDVISRLEAARAGNGGELQRLLLSGVERLVASLLKLAGPGSMQITAAAAAANPAIAHLLAAKPVDKLLFPPHRSDYRAGERLDPAGLGLDLPVPLYLFPLLNGYVGGDLVALLLAEGEPPVPTLFLDLGTNAELALWDGRRWLATSVAAGPAFEVGHLSCGMRHADGAVRRVSCNGERFLLEVAGGGNPLGLCGSGFFSLLSAACRHGLLDRSGRILTAEEVDTALSRYLVETEDGPVLQLYRDAQRCLRVNQQDVREFQTAKGAVAAGIDCLLRRAGLAEEQVDAVVIAGALGTALSAADLKGVAMVPKIMLDKVRFLPSAVLAGVQKLLVEPGGAERVRQLVAELQTYPLSGTPAFERSFLRALDFSPD